MADERGQEHAVHNRVLERAPQARHGLPRHRVRPRQDAVLRLAQEDLHADRHAQKVRQVGEAAQDEHADDEEGGVGWKEPDGAHGRRGRFGSAAVHQHDAARPQTFALRAQADAGHNPRQLPPAGVHRHHTGPTQQDRDGLQQVRGLRARLQREEGPCERGKRVPGGGILARQAAGVQEHFAGGGRAQQAEDKQVFTINKL